MYKGKRSTRQCQATQVETLGYTLRHNLLVKDIMLGPMPGKRRQGGQKQQWLDDLKEWTGLTIPDLVA